MVAGAVVEAYWDWTTALPHLFEPNARSISNTNSRYIQSWFKPKKYFPIFNPNPSMITMITMGITIVEKTILMTLTQGTMLNMYIEKAGVYQIKLVIIDACGNRVERLTDLAVIL